MSGRFATALLCVSLGALAEPLSLSCRFDVRVTRGGVEQRGAEHHFKLISDTDTDAPDAYLEDETGVTPVTPFTGAVGETTFVALTLGGSVSVTTVMPDGQAVHSRHDIAESTLSAAQYYGACR